ncbi:sodium/proton antiporter NhaA [Helicobacter anatolicus]|uniref:sodium/proton antiporter NhaA n=1 Tax=Helicobacter anatolicus TaxID=2905874 RepID=UPI001E3FB616|nr:sodium/proton antiporter NhaA [Helicobacter anatolicus]MCE3038442.1 sodium/proton antiporter NhaA [Helicobacter anatolicus]
MGQKIFLEKLFLRFLKSETFGGVCLFVSMVLALIVANSNLSDWYFELWEKEFGFGFGDKFFGFSIHEWINDVLMSFFFLMVGLEIKREFLLGELSGIQKAAFPVIAAIGGMVVPGLIYFTFNAGTDSVFGFGIPMATDIAFALGVILMLGKRVPFALKVFLVTLAVVDDLGAIIVIAVFYTSQIYWNYLLIAVGIIALLIFLNKMGIKNLIPYLILGVFLWVVVHHSGIHATIAAVLLAFCVPLQPKEKRAAFVNFFKETLDKIYNKTDLKNETKIVKTLYKRSIATQSPLERLEHILHPWSAYFIMPLFAFANAGVNISGNIDFTIDHIFFGVLLGLFIGKPVGIFVVTFVFEKLGIIKKPQDVAWFHIFSAGVLAGIGFTMSIFVSNLAFENLEAIELAKIAILLASFLSAITGSCLLFLFNKIKNK